MLQEDRSTRRRDFVGSSPRKRKSVDYLGALAVDVAIHPVNEHPILPKGQFLNGRGRNRAGRRVYMR